MSTIASCPRCAQHVSIPIDVAPTATVRCPICQTEYRLQEALSRIPPLLILVDAGPRMTSDSGIFGMPGLAEPDHRLPGAEPRADFAPASPMPVESGRIESIHSDIPEIAEAHTAESPTAEPQAEESDDFVAFEADEIELETDIVSEDHPESPAMNFGDGTEPAAGHELESNAESFDAPADEIEIADFEVSESEMAAEHPLAEQPAAEETADFGDAIELDDEPSFGEASGFEAASGFGHEPHANGDGPEIPLDDEPAEHEIQFAAADHADDSDEIGLADPEEEAFEFAGVPKGASAEPEPATAGEKKDSRRKPPTKRKPTMLSNIIGFGLSGVVGTTFACLLYIIWLWVRGPSGDTVGLGKYLPSWTLPSSFKAVASAPADPGYKADIAPPAAGGKTPVETNKPVGGAPGDTVDPLAAPDGGSELDAPAPSLETPDPLDATAPDPLADVPAGAKPVPDDAAPEEMAEDSDAAPEAAPDEPAAVATDEGPEEPGAPEPAVADKDTAPEEADPVPPPEKIPAEPEKAVEPAKVAAEPETPAAPVEPKHGLRTPVSYNADQLEHSVADLKDAMTALAGASKDDLKSAKLHFYVSFYKVAQALTFVAGAPDDANLKAQREVVSSIIRDVAADPSKSREMGLVAGQWLSRPTRATPGVALSGTVQSVGKKDGLFQLQLALPNKSTVTVVSEQEPKLPVNAQVIVLGSIVDKPSENLLAYSGDQPMVVWNGMIVWQPDSAAK